MTSGPDPDFAPRTFAQARSLRTRILGRHLRIVIRKALRGIGALRAHMAQTAQYHRELELLMHADDRMLADIGLTRSEVVTAAQESRGWQGRRDALQAAAVRRDEAVAGSGARRSGPPRMDAPPLAPALPLAMEASNFR